MARTFTGPGNVGRVSDAANGGSALILNGSSQAVVSANPGRAALYLSNYGATNAMFLRFGTAATPTPTAVASTGIRLAPGQTLVLEAFTGAVAVIGTAADVLGIAEL